MINEESIVTSFTFSRAARYVLPKSGDKWGEHQKERAGLLFKLYSKLKKAYLLICVVRAIFWDKKLTRDLARESLR